MRLPSLALAATLVALAACGKSAEEKAVDRFRAACEGFPEAGTTVRGAEETFGISPATGVGVVLVRCLPGQDSGATTEFLLRYPGDDCDHTGTLCDLGWCNFPSDPDLCGPTGCWYGCGLRVVPDAVTGEPTSDSVICGSRYVDEQPLPAVCVTTR
jgi:hypothetical protein